MTDQSLRAKAEAATPVVDADLIRYDHGGGRPAILRDGQRTLIADFYDEANREFYAAANPAAVLDLLDRLEAAERENKKLVFSTGEHITVRSEQSARLDSYRRLLDEAVKALDDVLAANDDYLRANPHGNVEPDPVTLACRSARAVQAAIRAATEPVEM